MKAPYTADARGSRNAAWNASPLTVGQRTQPPVHSPICAISSFSWWPDRTPPSCWRRRFGSRTLVAAAMAAHPHAQPSSMPTPTVHCARKKIVVVIFGAIIWEHKKPKKLPPANVAAAACQRPSPSRLTLLRYHHDHHCKGCDHRAEPVLPCATRGKCFLQPVGEVPKQSAEPRPASGGGLILAGGVPLEALRGRVPWCLRLGLHRHRRAVLVERLEAAVEHILQLVRHLHDLGGGDGAGRVEGCSFGVRCFRRRPLRAIRIHV